MFRSKLAISSLLLTAATLTGCDSEVINDGRLGVDGGAPDTTKGTSPYGKADSSAEAVFVDMEFDGELVTNFAFNARGIVEDQLLYTIGHLNGDNSVGRLDRLVVTDIRTESAGGGMTRISYHAVLPVAWGDKDDIPAQYTFRIPENMSSGGLGDFAEKYGESCVDHSQAHDVDPGNMWYYYRTESFGCSLDDEDVITTTADVSISDTNTTGKFPEYHKVWEDDALRVVAVFGKYEDGATSNGDAGIAAYNRFVRDIRSELSEFGVESTPTSVPFNAGVDTPDVAYEAILPDGKEVVVNVLLVDNVRTAGSTFNNRYSDLSTDADLIVYSGHAGLGANIRALAQKGDWKTGQYAVMFINGCDTYAYVDSALYDAHAAINPDDSTGTKYVDIVTNAMPAFFHEVAHSTLVMTRGLLRHDDPMTYEQMFASIDASQVVLVSGEEDNVYVPGGHSGGEFETLVFEGAVARNEDETFSPGMLEPGTYTFTLSHDADNPGGDADLYVRLGAEPTASDWDCRPFENGTDEVCTLTLTSPAQPFALVNGYANQDNHFVLTIDGEVDGGEEPDPWEGMLEAGTVAKDEEMRFTTPTLAAGRYRFDLTGTNDADLYVRMGSAPTTESYDCRPFKSGSTESCTVDLPAATEIHVMVRGWATESDFELEGASE